MAGFQFATRLQRQFGLGILAMLVFQAPIIELNAQWSDGRTAPLSLSPLEVAAIGLVTTLQSEAVHTATQYALLPGRAANRLTGPAIDCAQELFWRALGGNGTACDLFKAALNMDTLLKTASITATGELFLEKTGRYSQLVQAGSTLLCIFVPLGLVFDFSIAPIISFMLVMYASYSSKATIAIGPAFLTLVLCMAYTLFSPDPPPKQKKAKGKAE